ncbi:hypothetical protein ACFC1B_14355 [Streptomyces xiamenensis]
MSVRTIRQLKTGRPPTTAQDTAPAGAGP